MPNGRAWARCRSPRSKTFHAQSGTIRVRIGRTTVTSAPLIGGENDMNALTNMGSNFVAALVYALLGIVLFIVGFMIFDKLTPGSLWKELLEDQNTALGNLMAGVAIALAIIIAAAIH